jgi:hypothetical protein
VLGVGQFPAVWWEGDRANRYTDLLMHASDVPWIVELKVETHGQGQYYRHAIGQVALYRAFIRSARSLWPWFEERAPRLNPRGCRAAVAFPALKGRRARQLLADTEGLGRLFDVTVLQI